MVSQPICSPRRWVPPTFEASQLQVQEPWADCYQVLKPLNSWELWYVQRHSKSCCFVSLALTSLGGFDRSLPRFQLDHCSAGQQVTGFGNEVNFFGSMVSVVLQDSHWWGRAQILGLLGSKFSASLYLIQIWPFVACWRKKGSSFTRVLIGSG